MTQSRITDDVSLLRGCLPFSILLFPFSVPLPAAAQNFAPVARAAVAPAEAPTGQSIAFSSAGTADPDNGPGPLTTLWNFADGTTSALPDPSHAFASPGAYRVSLTASDGAASALAETTVHILAPPAAGQPARSGPLSLAPGDRELWGVNPDSASVSVVDVGSGAPAKLAEIPVGKFPRTLALSPDGSAVYVACQDAGELWVLDAASRAVTRQVAVGHRPYGVAVVPTTGRILVTNQGSATVTILDPDLAQRATLSVGETPRAVVIAADGSKAWVSHFLTRGAQGQVTAIGLGAPAVAGTIGLAEDPGPDTASSGRGFPNALSALAVEPSGLAVWVGGLKSNTGRGIFVNGLPLTPRNRVRGVFIKIDAAAGAEAASRRIDTNDADSVSAIAFSPNGRYAYLAHPGAGMLSVYDLSAASLYTPGDGATVPFAARLDVGAAPQGIVLSADGRRGYVSNYLSRDITVLDLADPRAPAVAATVPVTAEPLSASVANGKRMFFRSRAPKHSDGNYIACASCHADGGGHDGRTWDFTQAGEGLRNTADLRGRGGTAHGPVHWSANFDEIQDFENDIVNGFGGTGLAQDGRGPNPPMDAPNAGRSADLDDLAAYVAYLTVPPKSSFRNPDGTLTDAAKRGKALFFDPAVGCAACHVPPRFTDSTLASDPADYVFHDVGTLTPASGGRLGGTLPGIDTPSLLGAWDSAPYLHDGSAAALADVLTTKNPQDRHGVTSTLNAPQLADLVEYLKSLDGSADESETAAGGGGGGGSCFAGAGRRGRR